jgi:hypothetical protein
LSAPEQPVAGAADMPSAAVAPFVVADIPFVAADMPSEAASVPFAVVVASVVPLVAAVSSVLAVPYWSVEVAGLSAAPYSLARSLVAHIPARTEAARRQTGQTGCSAYLHLRYGDTTVVNPLNSHYC